VNFPRRTLEDPAINLTPLIDVVFLLLIFFMVTTTFTRDTRLTVNLPEADANSSETLPDQIEVTVSEAGRFSVDGEVLSNSQPGTLGDAILQAAQRDRSRPVLLVADAEATHQSVITAMDAIGRAGFSRLSIATRPPESQGTQATDQPPLTMPANQE
jgi:biopolymer transport protein ExbD